MWGHSWSKSTSGTRSCAVLQWWLCWCHWDNEGCNQSLGCLYPHEFHQWFESSFWVQVQTDQDQKEVLKITFDLMMESEVSLWNLGATFSPSGRPRRTAGTRRSIPCPALDSHRARGREEGAAMAKLWSWWPWDTMKYHGIPINGGIRLMSVVLHRGWIIHDDIADIADRYW